MTERELNEEEWRAIRSAPNVRDAIDQVLAARLAAVEQEREVWRRTAERKAADAHTAQIALAARTVQPESTERVEWETRREWQGCRCGHPGAGCCCTGVKVRTGRRRTITTYAPVVGPWERVEDTTGGDDRG